MVVCRSPVNELIDDDDVSWLDLLPERAARRGNEQMCAALFSQCPDVGLVVHIGRHYSVLSPVPEGEKGRLKIFFYVDF